MTHLQCTINTFNKTPYNLKYTKYVNIFHCTRWFKYDRDWFFLNHNCQTLTCTCQSSTYSPPESTHFFQRSGSILMPFSKKACGWRHIHSWTVWMTVSRPLKFTTDSNNSMGKSVSHGPVCFSGVIASERADSAWRMNRMIIGQQRRHPDCSGVDKLPTTSLFWKGHQDASRTLEKMCWLRRGVRWRLTCASKFLAIIVLKKISSGHIWTTLHNKQKISQPT